MVVNISSRSIDEEIWLSGSVALLDDNFFELFSNPTFELGLMMALMCWLIKLYQNLR